MNKNYVEIVETNETQQCENNKKYWYKNNWAFWCITLFVSITLVLICSIFIIPNTFRTSYSKDFITFISNLHAKSAPYIIGISGFLSGLIYNIKHKYSEHTIKQYIFSIISTCLGLLISGFIWLFIVIFIGIIIIISAIIGIFGVFSGGGIFYYKD